MSEPVTVRILDRDYLIACEPSEREGLVEAAHLLDERMRDIRGGNRMAAIDRIAVMAALNLAHELLQSRQVSSRREQQLDRTLGELNRKLDGLLAGTPQAARERV
ncbi:MAG: cell division protein ZapA [Proteobacteria bacterium]|nr:cell division protein ZapA [Pseudomonadota bacterium]